MIELREFGKIVELLKHYNDLYAVFDQLDTNDDRRISFTEFKKGFDLSGDDNSDEQFLRREFSKMDTNGGGFILFDEVNCSHSNCFFISFFSSSSVCTWLIKD